ncbi:hypothetical protein THTE_3656 [Thermogutta terrifontis]|uniref:Uncharacterized protein n=1 Tax=Thermogutta terrifontis TaxID=1331910 RepID=A0A286RJX4_9BACT|nr:hypothetical protein THTE_3656 [Thermogutta terrifontis]
MSVKGCPGVHTIPGASRPHIRQKLLFSGKSFFDKIGL